MGTMSSSLSAVQARINEIESRFGARVPVQASQSGVGEFENILQDSIADRFDTVGLPIDSTGLSPQVNTIGGPTDPNYDPNAVDALTNASDPNGVDSLSGLGNVAPLAKSHIPAEFIGYGNGKIPAFSLQSINQDGHKLWGTAAQAFNEMFAKANFEGVNLGVSSSYRDYTNQVRIAAEKGIYGQGGLAAVPGTSNHGWGIALDLNVSNDPEALQWLRDNADDFGFIENVPGEPWHWEYRPNEV